MLSNCHIFIVSYNHWSLIPYIRGSVWGFCFSVFPHIWKNLTQKIPFKDSSTVGKSVQQEGASGIKDMIVPISAGILSALRRVIARRVSLKVFFFSLFRKITICFACLLEFLPWLLFCFPHPESAEKKTSCNYYYFCHLLPIPFGDVGCYISK